MNWVIGRWALLGSAVVAALGLAPGAVGRAVEEAPGWEAIGPAETRIERLFTPTSGALLAANNGPFGVVDQRLLYRSDDAGTNWRAIPYPEDASVLAVSPTDHLLLYAAGGAGVFRSGDGGEAWVRVSGPVDGIWIVLEVSPADPSILYGVVLTSPPAAYGRNRWHEFRVSHDGGATWEVVRIVREQILAGTRPCGYGVAALIPHAVSAVGVLTVEGCNDRGMNAAAMMSPDEGRTIASFPPLGGPLYWAASAAIGGQGTGPDRWWVSVYRPGIEYTRIRHSKLMRTDDGGASWITLFEENMGEPYKGTAQPVDFVRRLAYNPGRPDEVFAEFEHYEPNGDRSREMRPTGYAIRMSLDAGATWTDLGAQGLPPRYALAVGADGRYLFAATVKGVYRLALPR